MVDLGTLGGVNSEAYAINARAPGAVVVSLSSSNQTIARPTGTTITIPAGGRTGSFAVQTSAVAANTNVSIYATVFGTRKTATLTVTP